MAEKVAIGLVSPHPVTGNYGAMVKDFHAACGIARVGGEGEPNRGEPGEAEQLREWPQLRQSMRVVSC